MMENKENCIEWFTGNKAATLSLTSRKHITKIKKLKDAHPEAVELIENKDGSICAYVPLSYIKISAPRQLSEEQKKAASRRLRDFRSNFEKDSIDDEDAVDDFFEEI